MSNPLPTAPKLIHLDTLGEIIGIAEFQARLERSAASARPLFKVRRKTGAQWSGAFVEGAGLAIVSHQTHRVFLIDCPTLVDLACEAGVEQRTGIILPPLAGGK